MILPHRVCYVEGKADALMAGSGKIERRSRRSAVGRFRHPFITLIADIKMGSRFRLESLACMGLEWVQSCYGIRSSLHYGLVVTPEN